MGCVRKTGDVAGCKSDVGWNADGVGASWAFNKSDDGPDGAAAFGTAPEGSKLPKTDGCGG